jgi:hypothetical protein
MADENPYSSPSAVDEAKSPSARRSRYMSRFERAFVLFHLVCSAIYLPCFFVLAARLRHPLHLTIFFTVHLTLMLLGLVVCIIIIRDLYLRNYFTANQKLTWGLLFCLLSPSMWVYFFRHAWKPRALEPE